MEYEDFYAILGVPKTASEKEIRAAYREKARKLHPDLHPGNKRAEEEFKTVNEAYDVLSNPEKRKKYDDVGAHWNEFQTWEQAERGAGASGWPFGGQAGSFEDLFQNQSPFSDFFDTVFGWQRGPRPGADLIRAVSVTLEEAYHGTTRQLTVPEPNGEESQVEVQIPPGVESGMAIRLPGLGAPGFDGGPPGDLYVRIDVQPSERFERHGADLYTVLKIPLTTALLGGEVEVPTLTGPVQLKIPPETQNGRIFRLRGKGMPLQEKPTRHGNLFAEIYVELPSRLSKREKELVRELAATREPPAKPKRVTRRKSSAA